MSRFFLTSLRKDKVLRYLMLITAAYLLWQISLCGAILSAEDLETSQRLSDLARLTVGFGSALLAFRLGYKAIRFSIIIPLACVMGFGAMQAEDAIVNSLADATTAEERLEAKTIQLFNSALIQGKVTLPQLSDEIASNPVKVKAFSKVLGFAIWQDPLLISEVSSKTFAVLSSLYAQEMYDEIDKNYTKYVESYKQYAQAQQQLNHLNFAALAGMLHPQLVNYAHCASDACRQNIAQLVNDYISTQYSTIPFEFNLEDFCKNISTPRYVDGRVVGTSTQLSCETSEQSLTTYVYERITKQQNDKKTSFTIPEHIKKHLFNKTLLSLTEWRELWEEEVAHTIAQKEKNEFGTPQIYGPTGSHAKEGREYAVAVFLPPVALGFSITVCFLHLTSLCVALIHRPRLCGALATIVYMLPYFFATSVPLSGFAGLYAKWLIFWQGTVYPFGILRNIIL